MPIEGAIQDESLLIFYPISPYKKIIL